MRKLLEQQIALFLENGSEKVPEEFLRAVQVAYRAQNPTISATGDAPPLDEKLLQSQKMEAVGRLAGGIAHDFNNLLTVIKGYCDLSRVEARADAPLAGFVEEIARAADRAADLTGQLLAFSRQQVLQPRIIDLNEGIRELRRMLVRIIGATVDLSFELTEEPVTVHADQGQLQQVLMNLVINARDAMPQGGLITITTERFLIDDRFAAGFDYPVERGPAVLLRVRDSGEGMDAQTQARIFEPFFTTKELGKGTGLGLSTVYGIVKQSGGYIWLHSEVGKGTEFQIYLPWVEEEEDAELPLDVGRRDPSRIGGEQILLVEDETPVRNILARVLRQAGYRVHQAGGSREALELFLQLEGPLDLLVTDIVMPDMDGYKLAEMLRECRPELQVLYISGYSPEAYETKGVLRPGSQFLQKPFDSEVLIAKIEEVLASGEAAAEAAAP